MSNHRISAQLLCAGLAVCLSLVIPVTLNAQSSSGGQGIRFNIDPNEIRTETEAETEEIVINFRIGRIVNKDFLVLYKDQSIMLPLLELFDLLDLSAKADIGSQKFSGHLITKDLPFAIDFRSLTL